MRNSNSELKKFDSCLELTLKNGKYICSRCKPYYSLIKEGDETICGYIPTLFDYNFKIHYYTHNYYDIFNHNYNNFRIFAQNDYLYRQSIYLPCKEAINLGTNSNPLYSCSKCYNIFDDEDYDYYYYNYQADYDYDSDYDYQYYYYDFETQYDEDYKGYQPTKIMENINNNSSICIKPNKDLENCTEAIYIISKGKEKYNCTKCLKDNRLVFNSLLNISYCEYDDNSTTKCLVDFCKSCVPNKYYFCQSCLTSNYEVNQFSGSCVLKAEKEPVITWIDIYKLVFNVSRIINGKTYIGPYLRLKGITNNQINSRHAFLIYLTFKIKHGLRYLQEEKNETIPAICEIEGKVEESQNSKNLVDYDCMGEGDIPAGSVLVGLKGDKYNINDEILIGKDPLKDESTFDSDNIVSFDINNLIKNNENSNSKIYNFSFLGKIWTFGENNSNLIESVINTNILIPMKEIEEPSLCHYYKDNQLDESLICSLEIKNKKNISIYFFNASNGLKIENITLFLEHIESYYNISDNQTEKETTDISNNETIIYNKKRSSGISGGVIAVIIIASVAVLGGLSAFSIYFFKIRKPEPTKMPNLSQINDVKNSTTYVSQDIIKD